MADGAEGLKSSAAGEMIRSWVWRMIELRNRTVLNLESAIEGYLEKGLAEKDRKRPCWPRKKWEYFCQVEVSPGLTIIWKCIQGKSTRH